LPQVRDVGDRVTGGPTTVDVTVRANGSVAVRLPDTPVMVTVYLPRVALAPTVRVNVLVVVVEDGLNAAVTPLGKPEALKLTLPVKPPAATTVIVLVPLLPCTTLKLGGAAVRVKLGPAGPASAVIRAGPIGLPQPVAKS